MMKQIYQCLGRTVTLTRDCLDCHKHDEEEIRCPRYFGHTVIYEEADVYNQDAKKILQEPLKR